MHDSVSEIFEIAAGRYLSAVDAEPNRSNQHEIGGLPKVGFKSVLGTPPKSDKYLIRTTMAYIPDEGDDAPEIVRDTVSWYDARWRKPDRSPEYRLYYRNNPVSTRIREGDLMIIARKHDGELVILFTPPDSSASLQLESLFGLHSLEEKFARAQLPAYSLSLPLKYLLEELGVQAIDLEDAEDDLQLVLDRFPSHFPRTSEFSALARERFPADPIGNPDSTLLAWMEREEALFRAYERHVVSERLRKGFGDDGEDVDEFISFSLSVQNRRKSRVGHAFENHLSEIFHRRSLRYEKGGRTRVTENESKPDFLFPGFDEYHDPQFPSDRLFLLGAKTTCKDRWRQVLAEGKRLDRKYLATLETGISVTQTSEMISQQLELVIPGPLHESFRAEQRPVIWSLASFTDAIACAQR
ncbi:type II restriction endonuclease [Spiribacter sp. 1M153]|uniref:type II restriction endonuclease n=1 Tax=Spiribacter roseus TaxID=1855875 RepID=UPI00349FB394